MTVQELLNAVEISASGTKCKVYFKEVDRQVLIGKFVILSDHNDLKRKNLVRFVNESKIEAFEIGNCSGLTRLLSLSAIDQIRNA